MSWAQACSSPYLSVDPVRRRFRVNRRAFTDPDVFQQEKERILYRSWQYPGHDSEVRAPGDFISRRILDRHLIFVRDRDGTVCALLNACTHRGAALSFLGPGGFATPDDVEMLELCQFCYESGGVEWNDVPKSFRPEENTARDVDEWNNELQLRACWTQYDRLMSGATT